ncbi:MAG: hypothetical protein ACYCOU_24645, partial [Sulfobacillus sp.]
MSDLIRDVVEDILQRTPASGTAKNLDSSKGGLARPNYQRRKAEERVAQLNVSAGPERKVVGDSPHSSASIAALSAEVRRTCLTHECDRAPRIVTRGSEGTVGHCEVIGRMGGSSGIWWLDHPDGRALTARVQRVWDGGAMAVVVIAHTSPHQVLLVDEMLHALEGAVRVRIADEETDSDLMIGIGYPDEPRLKGQLKTLANRLGRAQYPHKDSYLLEYPCAFVQKVLGVGPEPAMGVLLDVAELDGVLIADWIYQKLADTAVVVTV